MDSALINTAATHETRNEPQEGEAEGPGGPWGPQIGVDVVHILSLTSVQKGVSFGVAWGVSFGVA